MSRLLSRPALLAAVAAAACLAPTAAQAEVVVSLSSDATPYADKPAGFTAELTEAKGETTLKWLVDCPESGPWDFSSPAAITKTSAGASGFSTTFMTTGLHSICVEASNADGTGVDRTSFDILDENNPGPTARLVVSPAGAAPGQLVTLDASTSTSAVPGLLTYAFDADGDPANGYEIENGNNPVYRRSYATALTGTVGVRIVDRSRRADSTTAQLLVGDLSVLGTTAVSTKDGPLDKVTFASEPATIAQFLKAGLAVKLTWGDVFGKAEVAYYLEQSKTVKKNGKTVTVKSRLKITSAKDADFVAPGSSLTGKAAGKGATALRKLKAARVIVVWKVTSKAGDSKKGEKAIALKKGK